MTPLAPHTIDAAHLLSCRDYWGYWGVIRTGAGGARVFVASPDSTTLAWIVKSWSQFDWGLPSLEHEVFVLHINIAFLVDLVLWSIVFERIFKFKA